MNYLNKAVIIICKISAYIAKDNFEGLDSLLRISKARKMDPVKIYETILQSYLFVGFPACIESLKLFKRHFPQFSKQLVVRNHNQIKHAGEKNCRLIYASNYKKLMLNMKDLSPDLKEWMIMEGYGKVLGRNGLSLQERELVNISILTSHYYKSQLHSHLKGCINIGIEMNEIQKVLTSIREISGPDNYKKAMRLLKVMS